MPPFWNSTQVSNACFNNIGKKYLAMAEEDSSVNIKVDEIKAQEGIDGKKNGENEEQGETKSTVKIPAEKPDTIKSPKKQNEEMNKETTKEQAEEEEDESESDEELPLGSLEGPVKIMEGKRERKKVERLSLEKKETPEKKKFEIVEGQGTKLGDMERVEFILSRTNADQLKLLYRFLFGKVGKLFEVKKHIRQFSGFNFKENDHEYDKKEQFLIRVTMTALRDFCTYLDLERGGNKDVVMKRIMDFCLNPIPSGKKIPKKKGQKRKRASSSKGKSEKKSKKPKKETQVKETIDNLSDVSSIRDTSSSDEDEEENKTGNSTKASDINKKTKNAESEGQSEIDAEDEDEEEVKKPPKKKKAKETPKKPSTPKKKEKEKNKAKEEKKKSAKKSETPKKPETQKKSNTQKKSETPKKTESPKKAKKTKKAAMSSDSDSSDSEPLIKKKKAPSESELKVTIETLLENANLEEITMKAFCKQVYAQYPDFDLKHKKEFIKTTVKSIVS